jgi:dipeptidyl aminopeptidase/acylaminoacyl peptidase
MKRVVFLMMLTAMLSPLLRAQVNLDYQKPSAEILELVDVPLAPSVLMDNKQEQMVLLYRDAFKSIDELSRKELRLGGLRIDPATNIGSRTRYYNKLKIKNLTEEDAVVQEISGLPGTPKLANFTWSPDQLKMAFTHTTSTGVELWVLDIQSANVRKLTEAGINANMGDAINWFEDSQAILVKMISSKRVALIDVGNAVPNGPTISVADGKKAQNPTYQDLLQNKNDEHNFEQLALSKLYKVGLDGSSELWMESAMYDNISFSPNGDYVMVTRVEKPFSYLVPYYRFPSTSTIYTRGAEKVETVLEVPLIEDLPKGFMAARKGRRNIRWRSDQPSTLVFAMALDEGDPENKVEYRDEVFQLDAPFNGTPVPLLKTINRYAGIQWGNEHVAIARDTWWNTRNTKTYLFDPSDPSKEPVVLFDRSSQDRYSDPGRFVTQRNGYGSRVLTIKKDKVFLIGSGYSEKGQFPFLDQLNLKKGESERLYQSGYTDKLENLSQFDLEENRLLVRIESPTEYPNYYFRDLKKNELQQITTFENPFKSIQNVHKEVITYKRDDGLELSGTLYLPVGYDMELKEKAPMILWAYPREFKDKASAGQTTANPNRFTSPNYGSAIFWVAKGYVVLDGAAFPILGEGDEEPNDSFRKQLVANAKAAIDAVDELGYIDRGKVAVGGHSYGAFMVANLLSHSDLFAAGIARSGAYNRTLTPFGFQSEERSYWEAPEVYYTMSPFMHSDKMKTPLLLIHGEADNNSGTFPLQSIRYFNALKGLGATVRLVMLPKESHGYAAKESILHMLWEQDQWLEKYVK